MVRFTDVRSDTTFVHVTPVKFTVDNPNGSIKCVASMVPLLRECHPQSSVFISSTILTCLFHIHSCLGNLDAQVSGSE